MALVSGEPAFQQVAAQLREQMMSGELPAGAQLPSMAQLQVMYGVSSTVIRNALSELRRDGLVIGQQGKGVFVRDGIAATAGTADLEEVIQRLDALLGTVQQLDERIARLEAAQ